MPSPISNQLTRAHRQQLERVAGAVETVAREIAATADVENIDRWWDDNGDRLIARVRPAWSVSRGLGARYMRQHAALNGARVEPVPADWVEDRVRESLRVTGPVEFKRHMTISASPAESALTMRETLAAAAARQALAGDRDTVSNTIASSDQIAGWRRVTGGSPCAFCSMLASRGGVYGETTVDFQAHDSDNCTAEPLYERESEPPDVRELQEQWAEHGGTLDRWRSFWDARNTP